MRCRSDQIILHLFQPHQADQMSDPQTGPSYVSKHWCMEATAHACRPSPCCSCRQDCRQRTPCWRMRCSWPGAPAAQRRTLCLSTCMCNLMLSRESLMSHCPTVHTVTRYTRSLQAFPPSGESAKASAEGAETRRKSHMLRGEFYVLGAEVLVTQARHRGPSLVLSEVSCS